MDKNKPQPSRPHKKVPVEGSVDGASKMKPVIGNRKGNSDNKK